LHAIFPKFGDNVDTTFCYAWRLIAHRNSDVEECELVMVVMVVVGIAGGTYRNRKLPKQQDAWASLIPTLNVLFRISITISPRPSNKPERR
jgi:hypothetical protein